MQPIWDHAKVRTFWRVIHVMMEAYPHGYCVSISFHWDASHWRWPIGRYYRFHIAELHFDNKPEC